MDLSTYRREYAAMCSTSERERHRHHPGPIPTSDLAPIRERYADLWTRESIDGLRRQLDETPADFETERAALCALINAACRKHIEARASEVTDELERCDSSSRFTWRDQSFATWDAPRLIAREPDHARRQEIAARWLDALRPCEDLRAARLETLASAARALGFDGLCNVEEDAAGVRLDELAAGAEKFLERTAGRYMKHVGLWAARSFPQARARTLSFADALYFRRASHIDELLLRGGALAAYRATLEDFGIRVEKQRNLSVEEPSQQGREVPAACFAVNLPDEVRLVAGAGEGAEGYLQMFFEGGKAQHYAWVSAQTAARYPELIYSPDTATRDGAGFLFRSLLRDEGWLRERLGVREAEAREIARSFALLELEDARRACAGVRHALALCRAAEPRPERLGELYAGLYGEATGFVYEPATHLVETEASLRAAARLRGMLLASSLVEHMRQRYGRRWHTSRAAGGELIDIWNTASRYRAEELARLAWGGALDFDLLAEDLSADLDGE